jgi:hypothetical protein
MRVRLIKKFADQIDGVDLTPYDLGDSFDLSGSEAQLLIAEGWAVRDIGGKGYMSKGSHRDGLGAGLAADSVDGKRQKSR